MLSLFLLPELHPLQKKQRARQRGVHACVCVCVCTEQMCRPLAPLSRAGASRDEARGARGCQSPLLLGAGLGTRGEAGTQRGAGGQVPPGLHGHKEPLVRCGTRGWLGAIGHPLATGESRLLLAGESLLLSSPCFCCALEIILAGQGKLVPKSLCVTRISWALSPPK